MARKSSKSQAEVIDESSDQDHEDQPGAVAPQRKTISKAGAARAALAAGIVVPKEASLYIKERFSIDISPQQFSAEKSRLKHRGGPTGSAGAFEPSSHRFGSNSGLTARLPIGEADLLSALEVMKPLIDQLGVEKVKRMVELLG